MLFQWSQKNQNEEITIESKSETSKDSEQNTNESKVLTTKAPIRRKQIVNKNINSTKSPSQNEETPNESKVESETSPPQKEEISNEPKVKPNIVSNEKEQITNESNVELVKSLPSNKKTSNESKVEVIKNPQQNKQITNETQTQKTNSMVSPLQTNPIKNETKITKAISSNQFKQKGENLNDSKGVQRVQPSVKANNHLSPPSKENQNQSLDIPNLFQGLSQYLESMALRMEKLENENTTLRAEVQHLRIQNRIIIDGIQQFNLESPIQIYYDPRKKTAQK